MDIVSKPNNDRHVLSFSRKLFLSVISLFLVFAVCFIAYQYQREKEYKVELLDTQLQDYNERLQQELRSTPDSLHMPVFSQVPSVYGQFPSHFFLLQSLLKKPQSLLFPDYVNLQALLQEFPFSSNSNDRFLHASMMKSLSLLRFFFSLLIGLVLSCILLSCIAFLYFFYIKS